MNQATLAVIGLAVGFNVLAGVMVYLDYKFPVDAPVPIKVVDYDPHAPPHIGPDGQTEMIETLWTELKGHPGVWAFWTGPSTDLIYYARKETFEVPTHMEERWVDIQNTPPWDK